MAFARCAVTRHPVRIAGGPRALVAEDLSAPGCVAVLVFRLGLQLVLGDVEHDLLAVVTYLEVRPREADLALTQAEEAANAYYEAVDLAVWPDIDRLDFPDPPLLGA